MARDKRSEAAGDQGHVPEWVKKPEARVPVCVRCGEVVEQARSLYTLCQPCKDKDVPPMTNCGPVDIHHTVADVIWNLSQPSKVDRVNAPVEDKRIEYHARRLAARGCEESAAWKQAAEMVNDVDHIMGCEVCLGKEI